jgi:hypothetical protein
VNVAREKIAKLRALAASTTFPAEADAFKRKADELEAALRVDYRDQPDDEHMRFPTFEEAWSRVPAHLREAMMNQGTIRPHKIEVRANPSPDGER